MAMPRASRWSSRGGPARSLPEWSVSERARGDVRLGLNVLAESLVRDDCDDEDQDQKRAVLDHRRALLVPGKLADPVAECDLVHNEISFNGVDLVIWENRSETEMVRVGSRLRELDGAPSRVVVFQEIHTPGDDAKDRRDADEDEKKCVFHGD